MISLLRSATSASLFLFAAVFVFSFDAAAGFFYINPDYRHDLRKVQPKNLGEAVGITHDFPEEDPSLQKYSIDLTKFMNRGEDQIDQIHEQIMPILFTNLLHTPTRRSLARQLIHMAEPESSVFPLKRLEAMLPSRANAFAIANTDEEFFMLSDFELGMCWSVTAALRKFVMLSLFDPSIKAPYNSKTQTKEFLTYYAEKIERILSGEPAIIPGFKDLRDFTSEPGIEFYIKSRITKDWNTYIGTSSAFRNLNFSRQNRLMKRTMSSVESVLERNILPKIYVTGFSKRINMIHEYKHVLMPYAVGADELGHKTYAIWDPNFYAENVKKYPTYIIQADEEYVRSKFKKEEIVELKGIEFPPEEKRELEMILEKATEFCKTNHSWCVK